jgi:hypothetical protein
MRQYKTELELCVFLKKFMQILPGKRSYAGGPRVLQESTKRFSVRAGAEITTVVSVKHGMMSKAAVERPLANR